jgi:BioD-like phosphotransacetylase family protein
MTALYIVSWNEGAGKTALCAGIGKQLQKKGKKVGYLKPVASIEADADKDAEFLKRSLKLKEPVEVLSSLRLSRQDIVAETKSGSLGSNVKEAFDSTSSGKDVVLLEGLSGLDTDTDIAESSYQIAEAIDAQVVMVITHTWELALDKVAASAKKFGERLLGVVINKVPGNNLEQIKSEMSEKLARHQLKLLGVLPEDRILLGVTVSEIAENLQATVLCCQEATGELVGNVMIGALNVGSGADYFNRKADKVVIARGDRPDVQLAALATPTKALILSEDVGPIAQVMSWAEDQEVPILQAKQDTLPTVAAVEETIVQARFRQEKKIDIMDKVLKQYFDFDTLYKVIGI